MRNPSFWWSAVLLCCALAPAGAQPAGAEPAIALRWALGARGAESDELRAIAEDTRLERGTRLKFLVEPLSPAALYLILLDSSGDLHVLHRAWTPAKGGGGRAHVPAGAQWFEVDDTSGLETFFLLAASEPLADLERLLDDLAAGDAAARQALGPRIVAEIRRQQQAHREFSRPVEKPVMIGGKVRGAPEVEQLGQLAVEVTAERFFSKTITIEH
jgi:hypothetical protein